TLTVEVTAARDGQKYRCVLTDEFGSQIPSVVSVLKVKPTITAQPANVSAAVGATAKFTVTATGDSLKYQWQYYNTTTSKWTNSSQTGYNTKTLSVPVTAARDGQKYRCIVTAKSGATATSSTAVLKVKPAITAQPKDVTQAVGTTAKFTVTATGDSLKYQWQYDNGSGWKNSTATGYNTATLSVEVTAARNGQKYRCVITGKNGVAANSNAATLKVKTAITVQPKSVTAAAGTTAKFTVTATGAALKYQWQYDNGSGWKNSSATGYNTATLSVEATTARNGQKYRCVVTGANGSATSSAATLTVSAAKTTITKQPANVTAAVGTTAKFTVTATGAVLKYQWQYDNGSGWKNSSASGYNTATLSVEVTAARDGQKYRCVVTGTNGSATSTAATLKAKAAITAQPANVTAAVGATAKFTVTATGNELSYQWQVYTSGAWKDSAQTGNKTATLSVPVTAARNGQKYRCIVTAKNGTTVTSNAAVLTVKTAITAQPKSVTQAVNTNAKFTVTATGVNLTYQWQVNTGSGWKNSTQADATTATLNVQVLAYRSGYQYRCIVTGTNGSVTSTAAKLTVK
ncbi:MAG: immunoglobulin domain-containing protein, partial [Oscillospiraceae bacterium]|nr:immunoglobulin domain-containing protein [Oscillospiraceae bacterium]